MVGQNLKVAFLARHDHRLRRSAEQHLVGRHEFEGKCGHGALASAFSSGQAASAASFLALSIACSIVPTM